MAINTVITCDICGKQKGEVNHWWMYGGVEMFDATPWCEADREDYLHACGQECLTKAIDQWMKGIHESSQKKADSTKAV